MPILPECVREWRRCFGSKEEGRLAESDVVLLYRY